MATRSIQRFDHLPEIPELLKIHNQRTCASLGSEQFNQDQSLTTKQRHLKQIYYLERRCFL